MKVHIHAKNTFFDFSGRMGHEIRVGEKISAQVNMHDVGQMEMDYVDPHGDVHFNSMAQTDHGSTCSRENYDDCIYRKLTAAMLSNTKDNCTVPWFPGNNTICTKWPDVNTTFWIAYNRITNQWNDCNRPCKTMMLEIGGKTYGRVTDENTGELLLYFSSTAMKTREHLLYEFESLVAEIGGYLGLLLGYSCLDLSSTILELIRGGVRNWR